MEWTFFFGHIFAHFLKNIFKFVFIQIRKSSGTPEFFLFFMSYQQKFISNGQNYLYFCRRLKEA